MKGGYFHYWIMCQLFLNDRGKTVWSLKCGKVVEMPNIIAAWRSHVQTARVYHTSIKHDSNWRIIRWTRCHLMCEGTSVQWRLRLWRKMMTKIMMMKSLAEIGKRFDGGRPSLITYCTSSHPHPLSCRLLLFSLYIYIYICSISTSQEQLSK